MNSIIEFSEITKTYTRYSQADSILGVLKEFFNRKYIKINAIKQITLNIKPGEKIGLLGPNGSGKSTTMKILSGILTPSAGEVMVNGFIPYKREKEFLKNIGLIMGQKSQLWWDLPAMDTFLLMKEIYEIPENDFYKRLDILVEGLKIKHLLNIQVRRLSLGERMKMEIISMLLHNPSILLLDEPTIGLDYDAQNSIISMLNKYNDDFNTTIILTSHYLKDVANLCNRIIVLNHGEIIFDGSLDKLKQEFVCYLKLTLKFEKPNNINWKKLGKLQSYSDNKAIIQIPKNKLFKTLEVIKNHVNEFLIEEPSIEEALNELFEKR